MRRVSWLLSFVLVSILVDCAFMGGEEGSLSTLLGVPETAGHASVQFRVVLPDASGTRAQPPSAAFLRTTTPASGATVIFR